MQRQAHPDTVKDVAYSVIHVRHGVGAPIRRGGLEPSRGAAEGFVDEHARGDT